MLFDPTSMTNRRPAPPARGSAFRRWLKRLCLAAFLAVGIAATLLLLVPLL